MVPVFNDAIMQIRLRYRWSALPGVSFSWLWLINNVFVQKTRSYDMRVCPLPHRMESIHQIGKYLVQNFWNFFECFGMSCWTEPLQHKVWINLFCTLTRFRGRQNDT